MEEKLISFETAKLAEEKGFNIKQLKGFWLNSKFNKDGDEIDWLRPIKDSEILELRDSNKFETGNPFIFRPTQSLLQKWLRDIHGIHIIIIPTVTSSWTYKTVTVISQRDEDVIKGIKNVSDLPPYKEVCGYDFNNFEDALEDALFKLLKLI